MQDQLRPTDQPHAADLLLNDLYQFTCSYCYFLADKHEQEATFEVFFRKHPFNGQYVIAAGIQAVKAFLQNMALTLQNKQALKKCLPDLSEPFLEWVGQDFSSRLKVKSIREGEVVFAKEPIITYTGPLGFVQLLETPILNLIGFASLVATNASRMAKAVHPKQCVEFGLRRAQGPDGGLSASHYACLGGFVGTSNIKAGNIFGIPVVGTMSHAFVTSFASLDHAHEFQINHVNMKARCLAIRQKLKFENTHSGQLASFIMYAKAFPHNFKTLIDTYDTVHSGLMNTIIVGKALIEAGITTLGVRLDSGDLCHLSKECRLLWNKYVPEHRLQIFASDDLHEVRLIEMEAQGSEIDCYAIGTHIATCKKQPALGLVCKLVSLNGEAKMKFSGDPGKATYPGSKVVSRVWTSEIKADFDLISLEGEEKPKELIVVEDGVQKVVPYHHLERINKEWSSFLQDKHKWQQSIESLQDSKNYLETAKKSLPAQVFALKDAKKYKVLMTKTYWQLFQKTIQANTALKP